MCGIAGFVDPSTGPEVRAAAVDRMCTAMIHRGPDDAGRADLGDATLGMRRLAIFDPANGHQPMSTPDGRFTVVFNGAIYNFATLRHELAGHGWSFRTECDTEVLLAAYVQWRSAALSKLRGMFAFGVWDAADRSLFLARDPFGIKPLYYRQDGSRLLFASELNALLASGITRAELDPFSVSDYLDWLAVPAPRTIYRGIFSLRPGEFATFQAGRLEIASAWGFSRIPPAERICANREEFIDELRVRLDDTIRAHVLADVPVGAFLSGGLDSAVVAGLMSRATGKAMRTFSIGFEESEYSEVAAAEATARHIGAVHQTRILSGREVAGDIEKLIGSLDQPTGDGINTYYASQTARAGGVTVALSGLGGDELFGGYPSFSAMPRLARWLPRWQVLPAGLRAAILRQLRRGDTRRRKLADFLEHARSLHHLGALQRRVFSTAGRTTLLHSDARAAQSRSPFHPEFSAISADLPAADAFSTMSAWEMRTYMADVLLRDSDVMSMRHSLELRVPFVDRPFVEWLWRQPTAFKSDPYHPKSALAAAAADVLPPGIDQRKKRGFSLPFPVWMRGELRPFLEETFAASSIGRSGLFDSAAVTQRWHGFLGCDDTREWSRVWSLAVLIAFSNRRTPAALALNPSPVQIVSPTARSEAPFTRPAPVPPPQRRRGPTTLLLAPELFESIGGIPRILQLYLKALCDLAAERDGTVRLVSLNDTIVDSTDIRRYANVHLATWMLCSHNKARFVRGALKNARGCARIICGHVAQLPVAWAAKQLNPRLRYHLVAHGIEVWRDFPLLERMALRGAESIFCVSEFTRTELLAHCPGLRPDRVLVVANALDPFFAVGPGRPLSTCPPVILTVARLTYDDRYKGIEHLIAAMPAVRAAIPGATLRIVGRGNDLPRLQNLARQHGVLAEGTEFLGFMEDNRLAEELRTCRLFALPSKKEGFGLVFLEAMAHGRPCLGARAGGIPEVITAETGVLAEYGDVPGLAAACITTLRHPWDQAAILARAEAFSYSQFKARLASLLTG
jgi:asparagine synthase (glutamine-hydrolysing)